LGVATAPRRAAYRAAPCPRPPAALRL